jgi:hypothetical protein
MSPQYAGDPRHPDHDAFLLELGRATYAATRLTGIAFDILRVHGGAESADLYKDPLGALETKLGKIPADALPGLGDFLVQLAAAKVSRNDLLHALPVAHGLHRRRSNDLEYVRDFFTVEALRDVREEMLDAHRTGSEVLNSDGGKAVREWIGRTAV